MGFQEVVSWYQKKIGTYDKQQWERTIEQKILHGFTHVPKKTAKLKTELIDVDLVRGSSFPKAKPKHGLLTVTRLAVLRLIFLPAYRSWWSQYTTSKLFVILFMLYMIQILNISLFWYWTIFAEDLLEHVTSSEILVPTAMMFILTIIHSQIVSTHNSQGQPAEHLNGEHFKRIKRRNIGISRARKLCSKSSPDTGSDKMSYDHQSNKFTKRLRSRRCSSENIRRRGVAWDFSNRLLVGNKEEESLDKRVSHCEEISSKRQFPRVRLQLDGEESQHREITPLDDDGFESLNGNGSSENGEECEESKPKTGLKSDLNCDGGDVCKVSSLPSVCLPNLNQLLTDNPEENHQLVSEQKTIDEKSVNNVTQQEIHVEIVDTSLNCWMQDVMSLRTPSRDGNHADTETDASDTEVRSSSKQKERLLVRRSGSQTLQLTCNQQNQLVESSYNSSCDSEDLSTPDGQILTEVPPSATDWIGITTNSEECSYSSELEESDTQQESNNTELNDDPFAWEFGVPPTVILSPSCAASDRVSCTMWENRDVKKAELSVLDISSAIIARVEAMPEHMDYFYGGLAASVLLAVLPSLCRLSEALTSSPCLSPSQNVSETPLYQLYSAVVLLMDGAFGDPGWERIVVLFALIERFLLSALFFFLLAVAERTFKQRFLYAKLFSHLTSCRRARKSELPHFRLNKVRNIKTWLSVRSYLKKRGPQRSVDVIVSAAFLITLLLLSFLSVECLKVSGEEQGATDSEDSSRLHSVYNLEALVWCLVLGVYLLRFMTLGTKINRKYRNLSVLITEQINLYLQIEQKPNKKEELMVANSVLKLAADLLKELESPFKISGLSANPYLYTITKVVILSALSGVLSEMLGFKLKLHKIKIK